MYVFAGVGGLNYSGPIRDRGKLKWLYTCYTDNLLYVSHVNCDLFKQSFEYRAPALWNSLPSHLRNAPNFNDFKRLYKRMIF